MTEPVRWGPDNPHPLFGRKTELVWDGKYAEYGLRRPVDVAGSAMPMQKIETVNIPRSEALASCIQETRAFIRGKRSTCAGLFWRTMG